MTTAVPARREICKLCLRARSACICQWITPIAHQVEVLILQHPLELTCAKGSARLLHLCLPHSRLVPGELFPDDSLLNAPFALPPGSVGVQPSRQLLLLYPETAQDQALGLPAAPALTPAMLQDPSKLRLVVLDGTWRKSRKMLCLNPALQRLPRLSLEDLPASSYRIRKAHRPDQLSTLEATCAALMRLEGRTAPFEPLLKAFDGFVAQQLARRLPSPETLAHPDS